MAKTPVRDNESLDEALRRFKRQVNKSGVLQEARKREFYLKPGLKRKLKSKEAQRKKILIDEGPETGPFFLDALY